MKIRQENPDDYAEVYELVKKSFATTSFSDGSEPDYLNEVRKNGYGNDSCKKQPQDSISHFDDI